MTTIQKFDRANLKTVSDRLNAALAEVAKEFGLSAKLGTVRYEDQRFTAKLTVEVSGAESREAQDFRNFGSAYGLKPEWLGETFMVRGETYRVTGLNGRRRKYPVSAENVANGKSYKFPEAAVIRAMGAAS